MIVVSLATKKNDAFRVKLNIDLLQLGECHKITSFSILANPNNILDTFHN
jgi:hypothetical protein